MQDRIARQRVRPSLSSRLHPPCAMTTSCVAYPLGSRASRSSSSASRHSSRPPGPWGGSASTRIFEGDLRPETTSRKTPGVCPVVEERTVKSCESIKLNPEARVRREASDCGWGGARLVVATAAKRRRNQVGTSSLGVGSSPKASSGGTCAGCVPRDVDFGGGRREDGTGKVVVWRKENTQTGRLFMFTGWWLTSRTQDC